VLAQVSSMKTKPAGSRRPWCWRHWLHRRATSARSCSAARRLFFEADLLGTEEAPHDRDRHHHATLPQLRGQHRQGQVGLLSNAGKQPRPLPRQCCPTHAAHRAGSDTSRHPLPRGPADHARRAERKPGRHRSATLAGPDRSNSAFTSIQRQSSCHPCWPPHEEHLRSQGRRVAGSRSIQQVEKKRLVKGKDY
ncbi:MAG: hypothetical protein JWO26_2763, partial [Rhodospirillales bacterium]|nr:hypothetical protein [Rhodospirillales bacterium]